MIFFFLVFIFPYITPILTLTSLFLSIIKHSQYKHHSNIPSLYISYLNSYIPQCISQVLSSSVSFPSSSSTLSHPPSPLLKPSPTHTILTSTTALPIGTISIPISLLVPLDIPSPLLTFQSKPSKDHQIHPLQSTNDPDLTPSRTVPLTSLSNAPPPTVALSQSMTPITLSSTSTSMVPVNTLI